MIRGLTRLKFILQQYNISHLIGWTGDLWKVTNCSWNSVDRSSHFMDKWLLVRGWIRLKFILQQFNISHMSGWLRYDFPTAEVQYTSLLWLQTIKTIIDSRSFKSPKSAEPRRVQVLDLYCLTRFESEGSSKEIVY